MPLLTALVCVLLLNVYAALLIVLRSAVYKAKLYRPMLMNIGLSFAPVLFAGLSIAVLLLVAEGLQELPADLAGIGPAVVWVTLALGTLLWLLFFPNSVYLITELNFSHRSETSVVPLWYDIVQTLALTLSGIANAVLSLAVVQSWLIAIIVDPTTGDGPPWGSWLFAGVVLVLGAVGVYLGRYLRFNSWDVRHPLGMLRKLWKHFGERGKALEGVAFVVTHAVLVALVFVPVYALAYSSFEG